MTQINDFIFCPRSIFFHDFLRENYSPDRFRETPQIKGLAAHAAIDGAVYSTRKNILQGTTVYSEKYRLLGRIDIFDTDSGVLTERKYSITAVYKGFRCQLYAQFFALTEMGFHVSSMFLYSQKDNKKYAVPLPGEEEIREFELILSEMRSYSLADSPLTVNPGKCGHCNYREICDICPEEVLS